MFYKQAKALPVHCCDTVDSSGSNENDVELIFQIQLRIRNLIYGLQFVH